MKNIPTLPEDQAFLDWHARQAARPLPQLGPIFPGIKLAPDMAAMNLTADNIREIVTSPPRSAARYFDLGDDNKYFLDLEPNVFDGADIEQLSVALQPFATSKLAPESGDDKKSALRALLEKYYRRPSLATFPELTQPRFTLPSNDPYKAMFDYSETLWSKLLLHARENVHSTLISAPFPFLVPGERFTEWYYWDTYPGVLALLATERYDLAAMQMENLLSQVARFGKVGNGGRVYYLTRSQPEVLSMIVREVFDDAMARAKNQEERAQLLNWMETKGLPLLVQSRNYWMQDGKTYDAEYGLSLYHDEISTAPRQEDFKADRKHRINNTELGVRVQAASGMDFTRALGMNSEHTFPVQLNSLLYQTEQDIAYFAGLVGDEKLQREMVAEANRRAANMRRWLWNEERGIFQNFDRLENQKIDVISADLYMPMTVGLATPQEARRIHARLWPKLYVEGGGLKSSNHKKAYGQWEGENEWMILVHFADKGLRNYSEIPEMIADADRLIHSALNATYNTFTRHGHFYERLNAVTGDRPVDTGEMYNVQPDLLWGFALPVYWMKHRTNRTFVPISSDPVSSF